MQDTSVVRALGSVQNCLYHVTLSPSDGAVCEVLVWCDVLSPIQVLGLHLTYRTPKRVVFDSMPELGVVYNMLVYGEGRYRAYILMTTYSCYYSEEANT